MKRIIRYSMIATLAGELFCSETLSGQKTTTPSVPGMRADGQSEKEYQAELRAELLTAPAMSAADTRRVTKTVAAIKRREDHELAAYEKFQFARQLALAEAGAPRYVISSQGGEGGLASNSLAGQFMRAAYHTSSSAASHGARRKGIPGGSMPDRFFVKSVVNDSADKAVSDSAERETSAQNQEAIRNQAGQSDNVPYGAPVAGRQGMVTSPYTKSPGLIDIQGYSTGEKVIDPYSGKIIRVP